MTARIPSLLALLLAAGLGLSACNEQPTQVNDVGSGDGPTEGAGSSSGRDPGTPAPDAGN